MTRPRTFSPAIGAAGAVLLGVSVGLALRWVDVRAADWVLAVVTAAVLVPTTVEAARRLRRREIRVDLIAILAMATALWLQEYLAGSVIALMLTTGAALEALAAARAKAALTSLLERAPSVVSRRVGDRWVQSPIDRVRLGDVLLVRAGEVLPADGLLRTEGAVLDEASLTGEAAPSTYERGDTLRSGTTNAGDALELRVSTLPAESTYARVLRLVRDAEDDQAPLARLADRYALGFLVLTLVVASLAWLVSGSPTRALAVLVVATPCPLVLAVPAALISGVSRAARAGIIAKGGAALEALARTEVLLLDKTGTVTAARAVVRSVMSLGRTPVDSWLNLAASLEQTSLHPFAPVVVQAARERGLDLSFPTDVEESVGRGIRGRVGEISVAVGQLNYVDADGPRTEALRAVARRVSVEGSASVYVAVDGVLAGVLLLEDPIRPEAARTIRELRALGIRQIHMVTGDHPEVAELVGDVLGVDHVFAERDPEAKVAVARSVRSEGFTAMVGDGMNDAAAIATADVGIAMGTPGASAASEAADVVLLSGRFGSLVDAIAIARRTRRIALQSVGLGMGLALLAMGFAAVGLLTPVAGALVQEAIDVLAIANALRALRGGLRSHRVSQAERELSDSLEDSHQRLRPRVDELAELADRLESMSPLEAYAALVQTCDALDHELLPHERSEERDAYPVIRARFDAEDPTGPLMRTHREVERMARLLRRLVESLAPEGPAPGDLRDLRRVLYGLHAILALHFAQEEELYEILDVHAA